jgi:hypothetical protein
MMKEPDSHDNGKDENRGRSVLDAARAKSGGDGV